jgi:hypothetical protein
MESTYTQKSSYIVLARGEPVVAGACGLLIEGRTTEVAMFESVQLKKDKRNRTL